MLALQLYNFLFRFTCFGSDLDCCLQSLGEAYPLCLHNIPHIMLYKHNEDASPKDLNYTNIEAVLETIKS
jgi:hypothetical protein